MNSKRDNEREKRMECDYFGSLFVREITLISVANVFPLSFVDWTVCLHSFSLLGPLHACYSNEEKLV